MIYITRSEVTMFSFLGWLCGESATNFSYVWEPPDLLEDEHDEKHKDFLFWSVVSECLSSL